MKILESLSFASATPQRTQSGHWKGSKKRAPYWTARLKRNFGVCLHSLCVILLLNARPDLTEEEKTSILAAPEFLDFVEQSSKIVQRALNDNYDYIRDYTSGAETGG
jgi:hypothetical protein